MAAVAGKTTPTTRKPEGVLEPLEPPSPLQWIPIVVSLGVERKRSRLRSGEEKVYENCRVRIPKEVVERLGLKGESTILLQIARPRWYHLIDYREHPFRSWFERIKKPWIKAEICQLGHAPRDQCSNYRLLLVIASEKELEELGLEADKPITLQELKDRLAHGKKP